MGEDVIHQGYFSILRWRSDPTRDEARNVAVMLVEAEGQFGALRAGPVSRISKRLREQGLLDTMIAGLEKQFSAESAPNLAELRDLQDSLRDSLCLTEPQPVAVKDVNQTIDALYKAYVALPGGGGTRFTKGEVLNRAVSTLRKRGFDVRRSDYIDDFIFDVIVETAPNRHSVGDVFSFATTAQDWAPVEYEAGHFLYALERLDVRGFAVVQPPSIASHQKAATAHQRVLRWLDSAKVVVTEPTTLEIAELPVNGR